MDIELNFFDASNYTSNLRCTIHKTGKIGFSDYTQRKLNINEKGSIKIGIAGDKSNYAYMIIQILDTVEKTAFKINRAGNYYYINPKPLLDELGIAYRQKSILYEMALLDEENKIYKLTKKEGKVE